MLFELLGQTVGDPRLDEEDVPVVLRSWQAKNFLITSMHVKGMVQNLNVLGVLEVQVSFLQWHWISRKSSCCCSILWPLVSGFEDSWIPTCVE